MMRIEIAAEILAMHLGRDFDHWLKLLKRDGRRKESNRDFRFIEALPACGDAGLFRSYYASDVFRFIARRNPSSLGYPNHEPGCAQGTTYAVEARLHCDFANAGACSVLLDEESVFFGDRRLTVQNAKHLAQKILEIVDFCELHQFNHEEWDFVPRESAGSSRLMEMLMKKRDQIRLSATEGAEHEC